MSKVVEKAPVAISSIHKKGGCGKTTVLTDLGIYLAIKDLRVLAIDTDMQAAMFTTLTGERRPEYRPSQRSKYLDDLENGTAFRSPQTKYDQVDTKMKLVHYPIEMFYRDDPFYRPEFKGRFQQIVGEEMKQVDAVLIDMPPVRSLAPDTMPLRIISPHASELVFLVTNRPNPKELEDGVRCLEDIRELLIAGRVPARKIRELLVLNFSAVQGRGVDYELMRWGDSYKLRESGPHMMAESPFNKLSVQATKVKIPRITLPNIPRQGGDLNHYSMFMDKDINIAEIMEEERIGKPEGVDWLLMHGDDFEEAFKKEANEEPYVAYLKAMAEVAAAINPDFDTYFHQSLF